MRLVVRHEIAWTWEAPPRSLVEHLRIEPRNHEGQHVINWRTDVEPGGRTRMGEDAFGNAFDCLSVDGPLSALSVRAEGEVETFDTAGIVRHAVERFPPDLYLRESALTAADPALRDFADRAVAGESTALARAHALDGRHPRAARRVRLPRRSSSPARRRHLPRAAGPRATSRMSMSHARVMWAFPRASP